MLKSSKSKRFFYHYNKVKHSMIVHFSNQCIPVHDVKCMVPCESKWRTRQPRLVMQGFCNNVQVKDGVAIIA